MKGILGAVKHSIEPHSPPLANARGSVLARLAEPRPSGSGAGSTCFLSFLDLFVFASAQSGASTPRGGIIRAGLFCLAFCLLMPPQLSSASREMLAALFSQANAQYQNGDFSSAERLYRQMIEKGTDSGVLYYNLGNACFKQKKLGEAIYFWEKAQRRLPGDPDVKENLELAGLFVVDRVEVPPDPLPLRWLDNALHRLTISQDCRVVLVLFMVVNALFTVYLWARNRGFAGHLLALVLTAGVLFALFSGSLAWKIYERNARLEGVIVDLKVDLRSGPGDENIMVFTVHEGILVRVRGESGGWYQVSLPNGWSGWLKKSSLLVLD